MPSDYPEQKTAEIPMSALEVVIGDFRSQLNRLNGLSSQSYRIAQKCSYEESVPSAKANDTIATRGSILESFRSVVDEFICLNNHLENSLNRISNITGE